MTSSPRSFLHSSVCLSLSHVNKREPVRFGSPGLPRTPRSSSPTEAPHLAPAASPWPDPFIVQGLAHGEEGCVYVCVRFRGGNQVFGPPRQQTSSLHSFSMWEDPCPCALNERNPFFSHLNHLKTQCGRSTVTRYVQSLCPPPIGTMGCFSPALLSVSSRSGFFPEVYRVAIICSAGVWFSLKLQIEVDASSDKKGQLGLSLSVAFCFSLSFTHSHTISLWGQAGMYLTA